MATGELTPAVHEHHTSTGLDNTKMAMWGFLGSECLFFGSFISTYLLYRNQTADGPTSAELYDIPYTSVSSFVLLMSSLTMVLALAACHRKDQRGMRAWLLATALLGMVFIGGQIYEFTEFAHDGPRPRRQPVWLELLRSHGFSRCSRHCRHLDVVASRRNVDVRPAGIR